MIDFMVMEAVAVKVAKQDEKARKDAEKEAKRRKFKQDKDHLREYQ